MTAFGVQNCSHPVQGKHFQIWDGTKKRVRKMCVFKGQVALSQNTIQCNTIKNLHSQTDKQTVSLI